MYYDKYLENLKKGYYDGLIIETCSDGIYYGAKVENGVPIQYKRAPGKKYFFDEKFSNLVELKCERRFETEEEKKIFYQLYRWTRKLD